MSTTRADLCKLVKISVDTFKGMERHNQLPLEQVADPEGWRHFTAFDAARVAMSLDLAESYDMSRVKAAQIILAASGKLRECWDDVVRGARMQGPEYVVGRAELPIDAKQPLQPFVCRAVSLGEIFKEGDTRLVRLVLTSASRAVAVIEMRAPDHGIELDWSV